MISRMSICLADERKEIADHCRKMIKRYSYSVGCNRRCVVRLRLRAIRRHIRQSRQSAVIVKQPVIIIEEIDDALPAVPEEL